MKTHVPTLTFVTELSSFIVSSPLKQVDEFIAGVVNVERRSSADRRYFLEDSYTVATLLTRKHKRSWPTRLHISNWSLSRSYNGSPQLLNHTARPPLEL